MRFQKRPSLLYEMLRDKGAETVVVIDEIPEVPELLNEVHWLISERGMIFVLCGSSARKVRRAASNCSMFTTFFMLCGEVNCFRRKKLTLKENATHVISLYILW